MQKGRRQGARKERQSNNSNGVRERDRTNIKEREREIRRSGDKARC